MPGHSAFTKMHLLSLFKKFETIINLQKVKSTVQRLPLAPTIGEQISNLMCLHPPFLIVHSLQTRIFFDMTMISIKIRKLTLRHDYHLILRTHSSVPVLLAMSFMAKGFISESHIAFSCVSLVYLSLEHFPSPSLTLLKIIGHLFCRM